MIDSNIIEWLDFGDSTQKIETYSLLHLNKIFRLFNELVKNKKFPILEIIFMIISFIQLLTFISIVVDSDNDIILEIINYLKNIFIFSEIITDKNNYVKLFILIIIIIILDVIFIIIILQTLKFLKITPFIYLINFLNIIIFYYLLGPAMEICLLIFSCEKGRHKYLEVECFSNKKHILITIISIFIILIYIFITFIYSIYCNEIGTINVNINEKITRIHCQYEIYYNIIKIIIFIFHSFVKIKKNEKLYKLIYICFILFFSLFMSFYTYKYVYYYNDVINYIVYYGWNFSFCLALFVLFKILFNLNNISIICFMGWVVMVIFIYKLNKMKEISLITESNFLEFKNSKSIEIYKNIFLKLLSEKKELGSKILLHGNIKNFEDFTINNPEIYYQYQKLLNNIHLNKKFNKEIELPILAIIYILYIYQLEKSPNNLEIAIYLCYFLINYYDNYTFAISLCSKIKASSHIGLYYKFLLSEGIKEYLNNKLNNSKNEKIRHIQVGNIILYYLYIDIFKMRIYDAVCNRIEYFDLLRSNITTNKSTSNFLKLGETIRKARIIIMYVWEKIIQINSFSDEPRQYYMIYIDIILRDQYLSKNENKKYALLKSSKMKERFNTYHSMFLSDKSSILLIDGNFSNGKILYTSENFPFLFNYNVKELIGISVDDLLPNVIQSFHKELVEDVIKYSNFKYIFKNQVSTLLKNRTGGLINIKLFIKPSPNLSYGLTFFAYIQKQKDNNFIIVLDKDLKINGFSEIIRNGTMEEGYNLNPGLYGYHIGIIIPDIFPLLSYRNDEFILINNNLEFKGYLYQVQRINEIKSKVDIILDKIKNNKNNNNKIEDNLQNISDEYSDLISELSNEKIKPFSIFFKIVLYSFLGGKYKYYRLYINNDIITGNENNQPINRINDIGSRIVKSSTGNLIEYTHSKFSIESKNKIRKKIKIFINNKNYNNNKESNLITNNNNEIDKSGKNDLDYYREVSDKNSKNGENEEEEEKRRKIFGSTNNKQDFIAFDKIKMQLINKKDSFIIKIMKLLCIISGIATISFMIYNYYFISNSFKNLSDFLEQNKFFNITKMNIAVIYIASLNIKWEIHSCEFSEKIINFPKLQKKILGETIDYLLTGKNQTKYFDKEYNDILNKEHDLELNIYGTNEKEKFKFNLDNLLTFFINSGINLISNYPVFKQKLLENGKKSIDPNTYGFNELNDLIEASYNFFVSDIDGFEGDEKKKRIKKIFNEFPLPLFCNGIILIVILFIYSIFIFRINNIELFFLEKLINFQTPNFENFLKKLEELKKKFRNDINEDEEKEFGEDDIESKKNEKKEEEEERDEKNIVQKTKTISQKNKKAKKKDGNKQKHKKNKIKLMTFFFIKKNTLFAIEIILIILIFSIYYIISIIIQISQKKQLLDFDSINENFIGAFKNSFDNFILFKRQLELYENTLKDCKIDINKETYILKVPSLLDLNRSNFGNNIALITGGSGFKKSTLDEFSEFFNDNACPSVAKSITGKELCKSFWDAILTKGMEQAITKLGSSFGTLIEELNSIKNNMKTFNEIIYESNFNTFEILIEFYYQRAYLFLYEIFLTLHSEKLNSIINILKFLLVIYIIIFFILIFLLFYSIIYFKSIFNSFLHFIWILPAIFIYEDEMFYNEIIRFGQNNY